MLLNSEKLHPVITGEPIDPAGNPSAPDHWDVVPELIVQAPTLFGGRRDAFQMAPFARPHMLWHQEGRWRVDPYGVGRREDPDFDYDDTTFLVLNGQLVDKLDPGQTYLVQHIRGARGQCGIELVSSADEVDPA